MNNMDKKTGFLLLAAGAAILIGSAALLLLTLYGRQPLPQPFSDQASVTMALPQGGTMNVPLPPHINKAANLSVFFFGMAILAGIGSKLGRLGAQLIQRPQPPKESPQK